MPPILGYQNHNYPNSLSNLIQFVIFVKMLVISCGMYCYHSSASHCLLVLIKHSNFIITVLIIPEVQEGQNGNVFFACSELFMH